MTTGLWNSDGTGDAFVEQVTATADGTGTTGNSGSLIASPDGAKLLYMPAGMDFAFYSSAGTLLGTSGATGITTGFGGSSTAVYANSAGVRSQTQDKILLMYSTNGGGYTGPTVMYELTVNWNTNTVQKSPTNYAASYSNATYFGTTDRSSGSMFHDALNACYWVFGTIAETYGAAAGTMGTRILKILDHTNANLYQASAFALNENTPAGDSVAFSANPGGGFYRPFGSNNRHVWFPNYRVVATVQSHQAPMSIIRIPGTQS
jgi:hypothetical protein